MAAAHPTVNRARITRDIYVRGELVEKDEVLECDRETFAQLRAANAAEPAPEKKKPADAPKP